MLDGKKKFLRFKVISMDMKTSSHSCWVVCIEYPSWALHHS